MSDQPSRITPGTPLRKAITASWLNRIHDILWGMEVEGGRIIRIEDKKWKIIAEGGAAGGGRWTGIVWFGNSRIVVGAPEALTVWDEETSNPVEWDGVVTGEYLVVNLRDGTYRFENGASPMTENDRGTVPGPSIINSAEEQVFHVADFVAAITDAPTREAGYRLNRNTQGDIHARIT
jgi:hypothetical protein